MCRRSRSYLAAHGYDTAGFVANLDYCGRETGLARGFAHYEDFPLSVFDTFNRYVALGRRIDASSWASDVDSLVEKQTGRWYDLIPRSKEHAKNADAINGAFLSGWESGRRTGGRSSRSSITTTRIVRMRFRTGRSRALVSGPRHRVAAADVAGLHRDGQDDTFNRRRAHGH